MSGYLSIDALRRRESLFTTLSSRSPSTCTCTLGNVQRPAAYRNAALTRLEWYCHDILISWYHHVQNRDNVSLILC